MTVRATFRSKLLLLTIVPLAIAQVVTLFAVMRTVEQDIDQRARNSLSIGGRVVNEFLQSQGDQVRTSVEVLAADFGLKEAVATNDAETIQSVLRNHGQRVGADLAFVLGLDGELIASTSQSLPDISRLQRPGTDGAARSAIVLGDHAFHTFTVPLKAPVTIAWVVLGFRIDDAVAARIGGLTGLDVRIVSESGRVIASSASEPHDIEMPAIDRIRSAAADAVFLVDLAGSEYLTLKTPFVDDGSGINVVLQRSIADARAPYVDARSGLVAFSAILLAVVAAGAAWTSGGISRPLRKLADAAGRISSGDYGSPVDVQTDDELGALAQSFDAMRTAIAEREERISHQALHDPLTGLPNRVSVVRRLEEAIDRARGDQVAGVVVLSVRFSRMQSISSTLGHAASDEVISAAARQLRINLGDDAILGHVGTNEFVIVLRDGDVDEAIHYTDRLDGILAAGVTLGKVNVTLQTEVGIAAYPKHGRTAEELLRSAAIARGDAESNRERVGVYQTGRHEHYAQQLQIVSDLRGALKRNQVELLFQPQVALASGAATGAEALVRWRHPKLGWLEPDAFIPAAEQAGTIVYLTRFVIERAIEYCRDWERAGFGLNVSVNLSARDLKDEYLPYFVLEKLGRNDVAPGRLTLEITENSVMQDVSHAVTVIQCLRDIGVRISIDDFGTGYSSLSQLRTIPLHEVKIDRSFVTDMLRDARNEAIVQTTIELAHNMKLEVVAEGVEDDATLRRLGALGCEYAQGYALSRAVASNELLAWLGKHEPDKYAERRDGARPFARA